VRVRKRRPVSRADRIKRRWAQGWVKLATVLIIVLAVLAGAIARQSMSRRADLEPLPTPSPGATPVIGVTAEVPGGSQLAVTMEFANAGASELSRYGSWANGQLKAIGDGIAATGNLFGELSKDHSLLLDQDFQGRLSKQLDQLQATAKEIRAYKDVPATAQDAHRDLLALADNIEHAAVSYAQGLENTDGAKLATGNRLLETDTRPLLRSFLDKMAALKDK